MIGKQILIGYDVPATSCICVLLEDDGKDLFNQELIFYIKSF